MKRFISLSEVDFSPLSSNEAISTKGGAGWVYMNGQLTYLLDEVTCYGQQPSVQSDQEFDYREFWIHAGAGAAAGAVTGAMLGGSAGSFLGPPGTAAGAAGGAIIGGVTGGVGGAINNYLIQVGGY